MNKNAKGFTIVELLIVIVVIGILATITVVVYNGIQTRAKNTKTVNAAVAWSKAFKLYNADKGSWPTTVGCLGSLSTYVGSNGQCWNNGTTWTVKQAFLDEINPYISNYPEPDTTDTTGGGANTPRRGLMYDTNGTTYWAMHVFMSGSGTCPDIGLTIRTGVTSQQSGYYCVYNLNS